MTRSAPRPLLATLAAVALLLAGPAAADEPTDERLRRIERELAAERARNDRMERELEALKGSRAPEGATAEDGAAAADEGDAARGSPASTSIPERTSRNLEDPARRGSIYGKPFLARFARGGFGAYVGGYLDLEYVDAEAKDRSFLQHRFIPFVYSDVTEHVKVAAEIEFEYGGPNAPQKDGEVKVEFAFMDYVFNEAIAFRAGALLVPLGKFNLVHDSPVNDLTARPLVDQLVIPTTFTEAGLGFYGTLYPGGDESEMKVDYELYAVNGFKVLEKSGAAFKSNASAAGGLRSARGSLKTDNNNALAGVGRLSFSPFLGLEVGASAHAGRYGDDSVESSKDWLVIYALDAIVQLPGGLELQGEFARADFNRGPVAHAAGVPGDLWGWYGQASYHFMFDGLRSALPSLFGTESTFTAVLRLDYLHDGRRGVPDRQIVTPGLNFRPTEDTAFKVEYQLDHEGWNHGGVEDDAFLFSVATYF